MWTLRRQGECDSPAERMTKKVRKRDTIRSHERFDMGRVLSGAPCRRRRGGPPESRQVDGKDPELILQGLGDAAQ
jgi:hypothetical protein